MEFLIIWSQALAAILIMMTLLWLISVFARDAGLVDIFWGTGFVLACSIYYNAGSGNPERKELVMTLVALWGMRLTYYLAWRNIGKPEDFRYRAFRARYGPSRYWWVSFFQVFLLQGVLMWLISAPLLGAQITGVERPLFWLDWVGVALWTVGIVFETVGDFQLARFKANPQNRGKVLDTGLWRYTRHPNYFGDGAVWGGYALFALAAGHPISILGSVLMVFLLLRVSGVVLLEKTLTETKPAYADYVARTSPFLPLPPKR